MRIILLTYKTVFITIIIIISVCICVYSCVSMYAHMHAYTTAHEVRVWKSFHFYVSSGDQIQVVSLAQGLYPLGRLYTSLILRK